jgi:hypothetical protein
VCKEIVWLNIEFCQLHTAIHDEELQVTGIIHSLLISDPLLGSELKCQWCSQAATNAVHSSHLDQIASLAGFSRVNAVGVHLKLSVNDHELNGMS